MMYQIVQNKLAFITEDLENSVRKFDSTVQKIKDAL